MSKKMFKGFNTDLTCRGFQYEEGKEYETDEAKCCETGFHACEYPLDCFRYYSPNESVYHEVELDGKMSTGDSDDTKICATKIKIGANLTIAGLVKAAIDFTMSRVNKEADSDEDCGASSATGDCGASSATGYRGASSADNPTACAVAWGHEAKAKGCMGAHLLLSDWKYIGEKYSDGDYKNSYAIANWELVGAKLVRVDGEKIKPDTYYRCINGEVVEVK